MRARQAAWLLAAMLPGVVAAQTDTGALTGCVKDASGAVIQHAEVRVTNQDTNIAAAVLTNDRGFYFVPDLRPGIYRVTASHSGFKLSEQSGIALQVGQTARIDLGLQVGDAAERVTVTAQTSVLDTETSDRGSVIDGRKIVELPLNGRDFMQLAQLSPGVLFQTGRLTAQNFKGGFSANGNRVFMNAYQLDGLDNTSYAESYRGLNMEALQPSVDALQEFKIQTNGYSAEFGRSAGAVVNAVIKSGTNQVHGSAYEFHRDDHLDANNFFANSTSTARPFHLRNQFGGTLGGPIRKNRTFIFGDYEGLRDDTSGIQISSVPQTSWTQGLFNVPITNPYDAADKATGFMQPATVGCNDGKGHCWVIPASLFDPVGAKILSFNPAPNIGAPGQLTNNYVSDPTAGNQTNQFDVRIDHTVTSRINLFGRYSFVNTHIFTPPPRAGYSEGSTSDAFGTSRNRSQSMATGVTWVIQPALLSETRFGYNNGAYYQLPPLAGSPCPLELIGLKGSVTDPSVCGGVPVVTMPPGPGSNMGRSTSVPAWNTPQGYDLRQSLAWTRGAHALKFGFEYEYLTTGISDNGATLGSFSFSGRFSGQNGTYPGGVADLLMGLPTGYSQDSNSIYNRYQDLYSAYAQDDWKLAPKLTLNFGLRWDFATPPREQHNQWEQFDFTTNSLIYAKNGSLHDEALVYPNYKNFAPRFGFAWAPLRGWTIRSAFGIFYNLTDRTGREGLMGYNFPFAINSSASISGSGNLTASQALFRMQDGIPASLTNPNAINQTTVAHQYEEAHQKTAYVEQWNLTVQRELMRDLVLDVAYVGNRGIHLPTFRDVNQNPVTFNAATGAPVAQPKPLAQYGFNSQIEYMEFQGYSNYNSLQTRLEKRFSQGLSALVSYTWGKTLADSIDQLASGGDATTYQGVKRGPQNGYDRRSEYGPSDFDISMRLNVSAVWQIPFGRGRRFGSSGGALTNLVLGGWDFSPIFTAEGGLPLTIAQPQLLNLGSNRVSRPNRVENTTGVLPDSQRSVYQWFNVNDFVELQTTPGVAGFVPFQAFGNSGVGILRGPNLQTLDFSLAKEFGISESQTLQFRSEFFNSLNRANLGIPNITMGPGFGQITTTATSARQIQFALKYRF
ncbi:MAG TPA: carboxypeptidase regulatory-like domain-containing protein [Bryobacteraceae bacterium]|nr:carboxypeptidase regulatory-like domain-containing protein [Bryobacteraceae bacterium]